MGNCVCMGHQTTTSLSGEAWGSFSSKYKFRRSSMVSDDDDDGERLLGGEGCVTSSFGRGYSSSSSSRVRKEIKIRMTKKDLEDLMRRVNMKSMTHEEILAILLMDGGDHIPPANQQSWRPALQSIPEADD